MACRDLLLLGVSSYETSLLNARIVVFKLYFLYAHLHKKIQWMTGTTAPVLSTISLLKVDCSESPTLSARRPFGGVLTPPFYSPSHDIVQRKQFCPPLAPNFFPKTARRMSL